MAGSAGVGGAGVDHSTTINRDVAGNHAKIIPLHDGPAVIQITKADGTTTVLAINTSTGVVSVGDAGYSDKLFSDNDIPNKKYVDDEAFFNSMLFG